MVSGAAARGRRAHLVQRDGAHDALFARLADVLGGVWGVRRLAVDATGLGETLARLLMRRLGEEIVRPVRFTAEAKSRLGYGLLAAVNGGRLREVHHRRVAGVRRILARNRTRARALPSEPPR